ncbi:sialin-like [Centruroides vittatus]|uniref:sialin-like n=1 Tax=Centruroides vittatus TaxID=120091 RepID=UPI00350F256F
MASEKKEKSMKLLSEYERKNFKKSIFQGEYPWPPSLQGIVLGSYFYGFTCTQMAGGTITERLGPKNVFTGTLLISSLATMLIPCLSEYGAALVIVLRSLTGLAQGVAYPAMYTLLSRWSPVVERGTLVAFCWTGNNIGTILSMTVTGYLCEYGFSGGWPSAFYLFGALGCLMFLILLLFLYESPESHPRISNKELLYIQQDQTNITAKQKNNTPWKGILTSGAVWSLAITRFCSAWAFFTLLTKLPAYFESVLHSPIDENGWMNSVFHFLLALSTLFCGYFSDFLRKKNMCSLTTLRKFFASGGRLLVSICLMIVTQIGCDKTLAISLLAISLTAFGVNAGGDVPIIMDMANNYADVFPARYILTLLAFLTMCFQYAQRVILSITMVTMVNITDTNGQNLTERLVKDNNVEIIQIYKESKQYDWSPTTQGIMLAGFFYGFLFGQLNAGWVISRIGAKLIFVGGTAVCSLSVFIIPLITDFGYEVVVIARIFTGLSQGLSFPAMYNLIAKWAPIRERSALLSISVSGNSIGTVLSMILGGYLCKYGFFGGWPSAFYVFGLLGFVLTILLAVLIYESPEVHPRISKQELIYIIENTPNVTDKKQPIPWKSILTSKPVWTVGVTKFCWGWGYYTILTKLPVYMETILHYSVDKNGFLNALFHTAEGLSSISSGFLSDYLRNRQCLKITVIRKIFEAGGMLGPAICLIAIPLIGYNPLMVIIMLTLSLGLFGMTGGGDFPTVVDMAPSFAGVIYSLVNSVGCSSAVFCPYVAGVLLEESHGSIEKWSLVFYISAGFFVFGGILFLLTASSEVQPWATITKDDKPLFREKTDNFVDNSKESDVNVKV